MRDGYRVIDTDTHVGPTADVLYEYGSKELLARGKTVFGQRCRDCHDPAVGEAPEKAVIAMKKLSFNSAVKIRHECVRDLLREAGVLIRFATHPPDSCGRPARRAESRKLLQSTARPAGPVPLRRGTY